MTYCTNGVTCNCDANIRVGSDAELNGAFADTSYLGVSSATPAVFTNIMIRVKNTAYIWTPEPNDILGIKAIYP